MEFAALHNNVDSSSILTVPKRGRPRKSKNIAGVAFRKEGMLCKVGNPKCGLELGGSLATGAIGVVPCDICCSELNFCRDCLCILCGKSINCDYTSYTSIRCLARLSGAGFCGHGAHLMCALECQMAGVVKQLGLDMQYICRRCDQKTDLREHVVRLLDSLRYTNSTTTVEGNLGMALQIMDGTRHGGAKSLHSLVKIAIQMLRKGSSIQEVFDMLHNTGLAALTAKDHGTTEKASGTTDAITGQEGVNAD